jgi:hypothetical protein
MTATALQITMTSCMGSYGVVIQATSATDESRIAPTHQAVANATATDATSATATPLLIATLSRVRPVPLSVCCALIALRTGSVASRSAFVQNPCSRVGEVAFIDCHTLRGASAGISGALAGQTTVVAPEAGTTAGAIAAAARQILDDYGHRGIIRITGHNGHVIFEPADAHPATPPRV